MSGDYNVRAVKEKSTRRMGRKENPKRLTNSHYRWGRRKGVLRVGKGR